MLCGVTESCIVLSSQLLHRRRILYVGYVCSQASHYSCGGVDSAGLLQRSTLRVRWRGAAGVRRRFDVDSTLNKITYKLSVYYQSTL